MRIGLIGASGRMGRAIARVAAESGTATIAHAIGSGTDLNAVSPDSVDVLVDFSSPAALPAVLALACRIGRPLLVGSTGLTPDHNHAIDQAAREVAVLQTGNTSLGINLLQVLVTQAARALGPEWDVEILELHHRLKQDAPSGTALMLGAAAARARGIAPPHPRARIGQAPGPREDGSIGYASLRGGTAAGEHTVLFAGEGEQLRFTHIAEDRIVFARGALKAATWLVGRAPGRYSMADLFG